MSKTLRILVVEDDEESAKMLIELLRVAGSGRLTGAQFENIEIRHVTNQQDATKAILETQYEIILVDLYYPVVPNGPLDQDEKTMQVLKWEPDLAENPPQALKWMSELRVQQPRAVIIIMTRYGTVEHAISAFRDHHVNEFLTKEEPFDEIVQRINAAWRNAQGISLASSSSMPQSTQVRVHVFLCHTTKDKLAVRELAQRLRADKIQPWLDEDEILPGQDWEQEIQKALRASDIVVICLSRNSVTKEGYVQKEIRHALNVAEEKPEGTIFLILLRLEECEVPDKLRRWQWVDLFAPKGYEKLVRALHKRWNRGVVSPG
jgi:CheY-like chemotaxis protein